MRLKSSAGEGAAFTRSAVRPAIEKSMVARRYANMIVKCVTT
jgi:hypothetical protein